MSNHFRTTLIASAATTLIFAFSACGTEVATAPAQIDVGSADRGAQSPSRHPGSPDALERQLAEDSQGKSGAVSADSAERLGVQASHPR